MTDKFNFSFNNEKLREKYNPDGSILRQAQMRMLEMLLFIDSVCQEYHLDYWLDSGTLLGAVRHNGFIPWDDDVDICMPVSDYHRFKEIMLDEYTKDYVLQCSETDSRYYGTWGVLRDLHSELDDGSTRLGGFIYNGLQVDIFPIDDRCNKRLWKISRLFFAYMVNAPLFEGRFTKYIRWSVPLSYFILTKCMIPLFRMMTPSSKTNLYFRYGMFWYHCIPRSVIYPLQQIEFEGAKFCAPHDVNLYLKELYNEWWKLPSEDKIRTHNFSVKFK